MARVENSVVIERPVAEVWDFFMDWSNNEKWYGGTRVIQVTEGPPGLGTKIQLQPPLGLWKVPTPPVQIVEFELHHLVKFNGTGAMSKMVPTSFIFESLGPTSTRFTKVQDYQGPMKALSALAGWQHSKREEYFAKLKRLLEQPASAAKSAN
jgi:hypothetical protein